MRKQHLPLFFIVTASRAMQTVLFFFTGSLKFQHFWLHSLQIHCCLQWTMDWIAGVWWCRSLVARLERKRKPGRPETLTWISLPRNPGYCFVSAKGCTSPALTCYCLLLSCYCPVIAPVPVLLFFWRVRILPALLARRRALFPVLTGSSVGCTLRLRHEN